MGLNIWRGRRNSSRRDREIRRSGPGRSPWLEILETRELLSTLYVAVGGSGTGTTASPFGTIQQAVTAASSGDEIRVATGTYTYDPGSDKFGPKKQFSYADVLGTTPVVALMGKQLSIRGGYSTANWVTSDPVDNPTIIDGQGTHRDVFVLATSDPTGLTLDGFTLQNGLAQGFSKRSGNDGTFGFGGGVFVDSGGAQTQTSPYVFSNLIFHNNRAVASPVSTSDGSNAAGGAIALRNVNNATLKNDVFDGNQAVGSAGSTLGGSGLGGAIHADASKIVGDTLTFTNNVAQAADTSGSGKNAGGTTADALGGAVADMHGSNVTLTHVIATGNSAIGGKSGGQGGSGYGGAFYVENSNTLLSLIDAYIQGNKAQGGTGSTFGGAAGGGAVMSQSGGVTINQSRIVGNSAVTGNGGTAGTGNGAGIYLFQPAGNVSITNTVIAGNSLIVGSGTGDLLGGGGALYLQGGTSTLTHVTIDNNTIGSSIIAPAIYEIENSALTINYSIISNNTGSTSSAIVASTRSTVGLNHVLSYNNSQNLVNSSNGGSVTGSETRVNPTAPVPSLYVSPGPQNWDYHLNRKLTSNPAIDAATGSTTTVDLDNNPRDSKPDLGAFEAVNPRIEFAAPVIIGSGGKATLTIRRIGDPSDAVTVLVSITGGSAVSGTDFDPIGTVTVTFNPNETTKTLVIQSKSGAANAPDKTINVTLALAPGSTGLASLGSVSQTTVTILGGGQAPPSTAGPGATGIQLSQNGKGVKAVIIQFNVALNAKQAKNARAYALHKLAGGRLPKISRARYNGSSNTVTLSFSGPIRPGSSAQLVLNPGRLTTAAGQPITGTTSFTINA